MARFNEIRFFRNGKEAVVAENGKFTKPYDGSNLYNVRPPFFVTNFTNSNSSAVTWNNAHTEATVTHTLNCIPIVTVLNASNEVVQPVVMRAVGRLDDLSYVVYHFGSHGLLTGVCEQSDDSQHQQYACQDENLAQAAVE